MPKLTPTEKEQRADFVLNRLKRGFSFAEVQKQFKKEFGCETPAARRWVAWACDRITEQEDNSARRRNYNVIVEMYHDQIVSYQNELLAMQKEIERVSGFLDRRQTLLDELAVAKFNRKREIAAELQLIPDVTATTRAGLIEAKSRIRERMYRVMNDLARLRGFNGVTSDWRTALNTLLDNNLLPPQVADRILSVVEEMESGIHSIDSEELPTAPGIADPEDFMDLPEPGIPEI
ncbi:MAG: hypothetical protein WCA35_07715 [Kovacikia sp.]